MNFQGSDLALHIEAYREAGNKLIEFSSKDQSFPHEIALPISSLYRLYLELSLKQLMFLGNQLLANPCNWPDKKSERAHFLFGHDLHELLAMCRKILTQLEVDFSLPNSSDLDFDVLEVCIQDFFSKDITQDPFRYPNNPEGKPFFPDGYYVNVYQLSESINRVDTLFFDKALLAITDILQKQSEL